MCLQIVPEEKPKLQNPTILAATLSHPVPLTKNGWNLPNNKEKLHLTTVRRRSNNPPPNN